MNKERRNKIINYMDKLAKVEEEARKIGNLYDEEIEFIIPYTAGVHIYRGLKSLAEAVGETVIIKDRDSEEYPYEGAFRYKGIKFYSIAETKEELLCTEQRTQ